jgi:two-component system response regulator YesN
MNSSNTSNFFEHVELESLTKTDPYWVRPHEPKKEDSNREEPKPANMVALVVDDERIIADTLVSILRRRGYSAFAAYSGRQGISAARVLRPGLIVADVVMPGMDGVRMASEIRTFLPDSRIFLISGKTDSLDISEYRAALNQFRLLSKPIDPVELLEAVA